MSTEQSLDSINNSQVGVNQGVPSWATGQKEIMDIQHASRNDKYAELAYQNQIVNQNLQNQSALDELNNNRSMNLAFRAGIMERLLKLDPLDAASVAQLQKSSSNGDVLSLLSQLSGGQMGAKIAQSTPPTSAADTGFSSLLAMQNTLNSQNYSNNQTNASLAAAHAALATILMRNVTNGPTNAGPVGSPE
jgi:hypothetical protein